MVEAEEGEVSKGLSLVVLKEGGRSEWMKMKSESRNGW